jgi:hypothetical protein
VHESHKSSTSAEESRKFQDLEDHFVSLADNERGPADAYNNAVHIAEQDRSRGAALAAEEEHVLRCLPLVTQPAPRISISTNARRKAHAACSKQLACSAARVT